MTTHLRAGSPAELLALIPYLLGFHPADSLVIVALFGPRVGFTARVDLPPTGAAGPELSGPAERLALTVAQHRPERVVLAGYGAAVRALPALEALTAALARAGIEVRERLRVEGDRFWPLTDATACPPEGFACLPADSVLAAEAIFAGAVALPGRADLEARLASVTGPERRALEQAEIRVWARMLRRSCAGLGEPPRRGKRRGRSRRARAFDRFVLRTGRAAVRAAEERHRAGGRLADDELALLAFTLEHAGVRDYAWTRTGVADWEIALWSDVVRRAGAAQVAAPAALLAFVAWRAGQATLAAVAVARALSADPGHRLARMMDWILTTAVPPGEFAGWPELPGLDLADLERPPGEEGPERPPDEGRKRPPDEEEAERPPGEGWRRPPGEGWRRQAREGDAEPGRGCELSSGRRTE